MSISKRITKSLIWAVLLWTTVELIVLVVSSVIWNWSIYDETQIHLDMFYLCIPFGLIFTLMVPKL